MSGKLTLAALVFASCAAPLSANTYSFTGTFAHDNDVQQFDFTLPFDTQITLRTLGYGGGINLLNSTILAGGFEPVLQLYTALGIAVGGEIDPGPNGGPCGVRNPDPSRGSLCEDAYASVFLPAGDYIVAITQYPNSPLGTLSDGFLYDGVANQDFNNGFGNGLLPPLFYQGNGNFALDITVADPSGAPEPNSAWLAAGAMALAGLSSLRKRPESARRLTN